MTHTNDQSAERNDVAFPEELRRASDKFKKRQKALEKAEGPGAIEGAQATTRKYIAAFSEAVRRALSARNTQSVYREFLAVIRGLDAEVVALCILYGAQHGIGGGENYRDTALRIGELIADECWAKGLTEDDPGLARRIERQVRRKATSSEHRKKYARTVASRAGYKTKDWDNELLLRAGAWALLVLLEHLPDVFTIEDGPREDDNDGEDKFLTLTAAARADADDIVAQVILRNPVWLPRPAQPKPWTDWNDGGVWDRRLARSLKVMRTCHRQTKEAVEQAIRDGTMKPALDGLNALQAVPWAINRRALDTIRECATRGISIPGHVSVPARPRKTFKRNVMTYAHSSKVFGMAKQLRKDTMEPLSNRVLRKELKEHPFGPDAGFAASWYLAEHTYAAIEELIKLPAAAMDFLQKPARALANEGKPLRWISPAGVPWINCYNESQTKRVHLWLHDRGVRVRHTVKLAIGDLPEIDKDRAVDAVAPNFVHACDAAHLLRTVNAAVSEGITSIATVHDSFGCLAPRAARLREIIREEFVRMYEEHDVLQEVRNQACADLSGW